MIKELSPSTDYIFLIIEVYHIGQYVLKFELHKVENWNYTF